MMTASIVRFARQLVAAAFAIAALFAATNAAAFERQHHLGGGGGLSLLKIDDKSTLDIGAGLGIHYAYGITDQFNLMAEGTTSIVALNEAHGPGVPNTRPGAVDSLAVGISYVFDVIQWVPYAGVLAGGYLLSGGSIGPGSPEPAAGGQLAIGLDYQLSRTFALGVAYRQHFILTHLSTYPMYSTTFLRAEYVWGW